MCITVKCFGMCMKSQYLKMKDFKTNNCRLCKKVFCCKKCREKHETKQHNVFPNCEICVYGKTVISSASEDVLSHIKTAHWPLHCLFCKRLFGSVKELLRHIKCPPTDSTHKSLYKSNLENGNFPSNNFDEKLNHDGNKISAVSNLATSTPMQGNNMLKTIQEVIITPVDCSGNTKEDNLESSSLNLKRKVTFCDTPTTESFSKKLNNMWSATDGRYTSVQFSTQSAISGDSTFYTATESPFGNIMENKSSVAVVPYIKVTDDETKKISETTSLMIRREEKTVWINAVNISTTDLCSNAEEETSLDFHISNNQFFTPMVSKKKTNIVAPSPIVKKDEQFIKFESPVQISSTPNNSIIPVKSAPNVKEIFRNIGRVKSKCDLENWGSEATTSINNSESSVPGKLWTSVTKLVKNALQGFSTSFSEGAASTSSSLKRYYSDQDIRELPSAKRYKVTDVQCRKTIRDMTPINTYMQSYRRARSRALRIKVANNLSIKTFADKATQTDDYLFMN